MKYRIEIEFRNQPAFEAVVDAEHRTEAERLTLALARRCGWQGTPGKARMLPLSDAEQYAAEQSATAVCMLSEPPEGGAS